MQYFILIVIILACSFLAFKMGVSSTLNLIKQYDETFLNRMLKDLEQRAKDLNRNSD